MSVKGRRFWQVFTCGYCEYPLRARVTQPAKSCTRKYQRRCPICRGFTLLSIAFVVLNDHQAAALFDKLGIPQPA